MEENTNTAEQTTQAENMGTETQGQTQEGTGKGPKMFTQEEVNNFVQSRIARLKGQINKEAHAEYEQKLADLNAREMKLLVKEKLDERGMSRDLADIITCENEDDLNDKLDKLSKIYGGTAADKEDAPKTGFILGAPNNMDAVRVDPVRNAMGLNRKD